MIGKLSGTLLEKNPPFLLVDVQGVGYELQAPMTVFYDLPELGSQISLHTHLQVREDAHLLYGFFNRAQRELFRTLIRASGVGPKLALAILSTLTLEQFASHLEQGNAAALVKIPGVGKKTAERLLVELADKVKTLLPALSTDPSSIGGIFRVDTVDTVDEAQSALIALGYKPAEASQAVRGVKEANLSSSELIRQALKSLA